MAIHSYHDLIVWQQAMMLVEGVYAFTTVFPVSERYGLVIQLRRCSVSIPSNIAEGYHRSTRREYRQYIQNAYASCAEERSLRPAP